MAAKRGNPIEMPERTKHEQMCDDMSSAVYALRDKVRKPYVNSGEKLLPKGLRTSEPAEAGKARKHIERLHKAFKEEK